MPDIVIIGAGMGGLSFAITLKRQFGFSDFTIFEKAAEVGGTWRDNIYPGASSDTSIHFYSLSTDLNPDWSSTHGSQPDMHAYWTKLAHKYDLYRHTVFNRLVVSADWSVKEQLYHVVTEDAAGVRWATTAKVVISAIGILEVPRVPSIPGIASFKGDMFHSAKWDPDADLRGKRVAVVGNGTSSAQFVPIISQDPTVQVTQFCRTAQWFMPPIRTDYSALAKWVFNHIPLAMRLYRWLMFLHAEIPYFAVFHNASVRRYFQKAAAEYIRANAPEADSAKLTPSYDMGCKRLIYDTAYLASLHRPNLSLNWDGIQSICPEGLITKTGKKLDFDVMIFATGFVTDRFPLAIRGTSGRTVQEHYDAQGWPKAFLGTTIPGFPNLFLIAGPNTTGYTSVLLMEECQINYILKFVAPILSGVVSSFEVTPAATERYNDRLQDMLSRSPHMSCHSWYRAGGDGPISGLFPGPGMLFWWWTRRPRWSDYRVDSSSSAQWDDHVRRETIFRVARWVCLSLAIIVSFGSMMFR